ncbi:MAG: hypothetical protein H9W81_12830 [Enterococcus sp.]|nr:hypothetical protein [Enterococcus sp.]
MRLFKDKNKQPTAEDYAPLNAVDGMFEKYYQKIDSWSSGNRKTMSFILFALIIAGTTLAAMFDLERWIQVAVGVPLGIGLFGFALGWNYFRTEIKKGEDSSYLSLREKNSPRQRVRLALIATGVFIVISIAVQAFIPYLLGGVLALCYMLSAISFLRKTPEEIDMEVNGIPDPRDEVVEDEVVEVEEEISPEESQEYVDLVNSLPEEQRKILLNPKLNSAIAVVDEDDIKSKKKRRLFGK